MRTLKLCTILALLASIPLLSACGGNTHGNQNRSNSNSGNSNASAAANDNIDEFAMLVKLPAEPEEATWKETAGTSESEKRVKAVLRFSKENANKILALVANSGKGVPVTVDTEPWYPAELIAQSELDGTDGLKGMSYSAAEFIQQPYNSGTIVRVDGTDFFILELTSSQ